MIFMDRYCIDSTYQEPEERVSPSRGRTLLDNPREKILEKTGMESRDLAIVQAAFRQMSGSVVGLGPAPGM